MKRIAAASLVGALCLVAANGKACPCRGSAGPSAPLTASTESWGVALTQTSEVVHGVWDPYGKLGELGDGESNTLVDVSLLAAYRPILRLELAGQIAYSRHTVVAPGLAAESSGLGDVVVRARYEALDQPMPFENSPLPGVALALALRAPTGNDDPEGGGVASGTTGSLGASAASTTLGAWEAALGVELAKTLGVHWAVSAYGEAGYRFPDESIGIERQLGPRALGQLGVRHIPVPGLNIGAFTDVGWESETAFEGDRVSGTAQRRVAVGTYVSWKLDPSGLRGGILLRHSPLLDDLSANVLASTSLSVSLGYAD